MGHSGFAKPRDNTTSVLGMHVFARVPACNEGGVTMPGSCDDLPNLPNMPGLPTGCAIDTGYTDDLTACTQCLAKQEMTLPQFSTCLCSAMKSVFARVPACSEGGVTLPESCGDAPVAPTPVAPSPAPTRGDKSTKQSTDQENAKKNAVGCIAPRFAYLALVLRAILTQ